MSRGQTGMYVGAQVPSPMFKLPSTTTGAATATSMPSPINFSRSPIYTGCAGCASTYGATIGQNEYGAVYNPFSPGFQGVQFGNGPYGLLKPGSGSRCGFDCTSSTGCGASYVHPQDAREGRAGCGSPLCKSNAEAVSTIYSRGTTYGCAANPLADRLMDHKYVNAVSNWRNKASRDALLDIIRDMGEPDWIVNKPGGEAVWNNRAFYARITLRDESVGHLNHCDNLYATVGSMALPPAGIPMISQLSQSILYDPLRQELTARGSNMQEIVPQLIVAIDTALDSELTVAQAQAALPKMIVDAQNPSKYVEMARALEEAVHDAARADVPRPNFDCK